MLSISPLFILIIHSKYFPDSDWLKAHSQFTTTSNWWPNLEEFCDQSTDNVKSAASLQVNVPLTEKTMGMGLSCFGCENKNGGRFTRFKSKTELGKIIAKNMAITARRQLEGRHLLFGEYLRSWTNLNVHYRRWI